MLHIQGPEQYGMAMCCAILYKTVLYVKSPELEGKQGPSSCFSSKLIIKDVVGEGEECSNKQHPLTPTLHPNKSYNSPSCY